MLTNESEYSANRLRQDLWRAGHAHAREYLILALVLLRYVDETALAPSWKSFARPATEPNAITNLAYVGGTLLALGLWALGVGLVRRSAA